MINDYATASGGAELQMLALRDGLRARGHAVRLFASSARLVKDYALQSDRTCHGRTDLGQVLTSTLNPDAWRRLRRELAEHPPDVVHIRMFLWQISPVILPLLRGLPVLFQPAVYKAICPNGMKLLPDGSACGYPAGAICLKTGCVRPPTWAAAMLQLRLLRRWRGNIDRVAALSARMAGLFEADGWGTVHVLGNGVDERAARPALGPDPVIVYAGRLSREKGVATLLDAYADLAGSIPGLKLRIAGTGPLEAELRARAAGLGGVEFLGHLPRPRMEQEFDSAWVQVVPSLWHEPFGNVATEAMMRGTAVVASDVGGQSDIVRDGETGYLVPPGNAGALAERLQRIVADRDHAERLGRGGRRVALTDYARGAVLDRLEAAYLATMETFQARGTSGKSASAREMNGEAI